MALSDDIAALKAALRKGVRAVQYDGQSVTYQSRDEMRATLSDMERELAAESGGGGPVRQTYVTDRGFR